MKRKNFFIWWIRCWWRTGKTAVAGRGRIRVSLLPGEIRGDAPGDQPLHGQAAPDEADSDGMSTAAKALWTASAGAPQPIFCPEHLSRFFALKRGIFKFYPVYRNNWRAKLTSFKSFSEILWKVHMATNFVWPVIAVWGCRMIIIHCSAFLIAQHNPRSKKVIETKRAFYIPTKTKVSLIAYWKYIEILL